MAEVKVGPWRQRCKATAKHTGQQCKRWAVAGAAVCAKHGAGGRPKHPDDPGAKHTAANKAKERMESVKDRLEELAGQALDTVKDVMESERAEPQHRLKAAEMVLDRTVGRKVDATVTDNREDEDLDRSIAENLGLDWDAIQDEEQEEAS